MKQVFNLTLAILILALFALPIMAQDTESLPPEVIAALPIPAVLVGLIAVNNRATEMAKLWLKAPNLPINPSPSVQSFIVLVFSIVFGIASAYLTPDALTWLGEPFEPYPVAAIVVTGVSVSLGAGAVQYVLALVNRLSKPS